jgi:Glycosyl hydrolases family 2, TIM barrel domain/Glycosyl hydrolases family 2
MLATPPAMPVRLPPGASREVTLTATLPEPILWHFDHPHLYRWVAMLRAADGSILHTEDEIFGVRAIELRDAHIYLNGEPVRLVGLSRHADSPAYGLAEPVTIMAADFADLKRLNAVLSRPAHYPQADSVLDYADRQRQQLIREQLLVFRSRPFIAGVIFFTYQDYRTPNGLMMGVVDAQRQRRGSWAVLREAYAPAVLDAIHVSPASGGTQRATMVLRVRGPVEHDLPAYTLQGYRLTWAVATPDGQTVFAQGTFPVTTLSPGTTWSGTLE